MADYIICDFFFVSFACASGAYVTGLDDIEW